VKSEKHIKNVGISKRTKKRELSTKKLKNTQNAQFSNARNLYIAVLKSLFLTLFNVIHWSSF
jgi:hypothetical protein